MARLPRRGLLVSVCASKAGGICINLCQTTLCYSFKSQEKRYLKLRFSDYVGKGLFSYHSDTWKNSNRHLSRQRVFDFF